MAKSQKKMYVETEQKMLLPARTVNIIKLKSSEPEHTEVLVGSLELAPGVLMGNCTSKIINGYKKIIVTNCNSAPTLLGKHIIFYEYMKDFEILPINQLEDKKIYNISSSQEEHTSITNLCMHF